MHIKPTDRFGIQKKLILGETLAVSDIEKTALDCLAYGLGRFEFSELTAIVLKAARQGRWDTLANYLAQMKNGLVARRLGFLLETANVDVPSAFLRSFKTSTSPLTLSARHASTRALYRPRLKAEVLRARAIMPE